jgi:hypothetical protein
MASPPHGMQGMLIEWSPPITTGKAPASRMARTPAAMLEWLRAVSVWTMSASPMSTIRTVSGR